MLNKEFISMIGWKAVNAQNLSGHGDEINKSLRKFWCTNVAGLDANKRQISVTDVTAFPKLSLCFT